MQDVVSLPSGQPMRCRLAQSEEQSGEPTGGGAGGPESATTGVGGCGVGEGWQVLGASARRDRAAMAKRRMGIILCSAW